MRGRPHAERELGAASLRRWLGPLLAAAVWAAWLLGQRALAVDVPFAETWPLAVAMLFGSLVAGATSEGGGAIAFPVMTLLFAIPPAVARDFGLMIQSVGMSAAALVIIARRTPVAWRAIGLAAPAGALGLALGLAFVAPHVGGPAVKLFFCALWAAFAVSHWKMDRSGPRDTRAGAGTLLLAGLVGGVVTSLVGTGLDIVVFSVLVLRQGVSETVATPTSVVLMALGSLAGFALRGAALPAEAWAYWWTCVPVVVVGAPLGARLIEGRSRALVSRLLYGSAAIQLVAAPVLLPLTPGRVALVLATFAAGLALFFGVAAPRRLEAAHG